MMECQGKPEISKLMDSQPIIAAEIKQAMDKMKIELVNALESFGVRKLTEIANQIYNSENVPAEMLESIFIALPNESGTIECKNNRTINLMSHVTRIVLRVELNRMKGTIRENLSDEKFGYRPGRGTRSAILLEDASGKVYRETKRLVHLFY